MPPPPPPVNDCPDGYARDKDGNCQPNIPPVNCCDYSGYIPSEANMLPITALMKSKHELDGLHHEVFTDILTVDLIGSGDKRKTSGKAMGVLNPNVDTGHNTGFGMFRGLKDFAAPSGMMRPIMSDSPDVKNNLYVIGYARTNNFWNAFVKGVICSVNTNKFNFGGLTPENYVNQAISEQIQDNYEGRDGLGDKPKMQIMKQWLFGSANAKVLYVRSESPKPGWLFECLVNNRSCDGSDHINAGRLFVSSEVPHSDYLGGKHSAANNLFEEYEA